MTKTIVFGIIAAIALTSLLVVGAASNQQVAMAGFDNGPRELGCTGERVSVTVDFEEFELDSGEVLVLLDTTGSGSLCVVHVAANLPCEDGQDGVAGNQAPPLVVIAGVAGVTIPPGIPIIDTASDDTSFTGTNESCVYHDTVFPTGAIPIITDVIIANFGADDVELEQVVVTITGRYAEDRRDGCLPGKLCLPNDT